MTDAIHAECLCGATQIALSRPPQRATLCSCRFCQRTTGTAQATIQIAPRDDLTITKGVLSVHSHISQGSGHPVHRHFCARCAATVYIGFGRWPDMIGVPQGAFTDPAQVPVNPEQAKQIFVASAPPGLVLRADMPAYWEHAATLDGAPCDPITLDGPTPVSALSR